MLTEIQPCDPPGAFRDRTNGPSLDVDRDILEFLATQESGAQLAAITAAVGGTTHRVHARVRALMNRGHVRRDLIPGGPARGPGASVYRLTEAEPWTYPS